MTVSAWSIPKERQPPWIRKRNPAIWCEVICENWKDFKSLVDWLDTVCSGEVDIHQARPFQEWPRVFYLLIDEECDKLAFHLAWINETKSQLEY
jgi:hypothetical protein